MALDKDTKVGIVNVSGVAAFSQPLDGTNGLNVTLLVNSPDVQQAVLEVVGNKIPHDKVVFEPQQHVDQCSFCGKTWKEVNVLIVTTLAPTQGRTSLSYICFYCVEDFAKQISTKEK